MMRDMAKEVGACVEDYEDDSSDLSGYHSDSDSAIMTSGNSPYITPRARYNFLSRSGIVNFVNLLSLSWFKFVLNNVPCKFNFSLIPAFTQLYLTILCLLSQHVLEFSYCHKLLVFIGNSSLQVTSLSVHILIFSVTGVSLALKNIVVKSSSNL